MGIQSGLRAVAAVVLAGSIAACGSSVEGTYMPKGDAFFDSLTLLSDGKAEVGFIGATQHGTYVHDGDTVTLTAPSGQPTAFHYEDKCLSHSIAGTYCLGSAKPSASPAAAKPASAASGDGAEIYQATMDEGVIRLELRPGGQAHMTMTPRGGAGGVNGLSFDVSYETTRDGFRVSVPGDEPMSFTRNGKDLVATMDGETARFVRQ